MWQLACLSLGLPISGGAPHRCETLYSQKQENVRRNVRAVSQNLPSCAYSAKDSLFSLLLSLGVSTP